MTFQQETVDVTIRTRYKAGEICGNDMTFPEVTHFLSAMTFQLFLE